MQSKNVDGVRILHDTVKAVDHAGVAAATVLLSSLCAEQLLLPFAALDGVRRGFNAFQIERVFDM